MTSKLFQLSFLTTCLSNTDSLEQTFPKRPERMAPLWAEFQPQWENRVTNFAQRYVTQRLNQMDNVYQPLAQPGSPQQQLANDILNAVARLRARIQNELHF